MKIKTGSVTSWQWVLVGVALTFILLYTFNNWKPFIYLEQQKQEQSTLPSLEEEAAMFT